MFLAKIVRELSIDRWRARSREKRRASEYALSLEELGDCVSGGDTTQEQADLRALGEAISAYLRGLPPPRRGPPSWGGTSTRTRSGRWPPTAG